MHTHHSQILRDITPVVTFIFIRNYKNLLYSVLYLHSGLRLPTRALHLLHTSTTPSLPHPYWVTGFADAESSFILLLNKNSKYKTGYSLQTSFSIHLHQKERALLERIASFYGVGNITKTGEDSISYQVTSLKDLIQVIIPHFNRYP